MCTRCDEIDRKVERNKFLASRIIDPDAVDAIRKLSQELLDEKAALHPEQD
jgi:hypothetical protein